MQKHRVKFKSKGEEEHRSKKLLKCKTKTQNNEIKDSENTIKVKSKA